MVIRLSTLTTAELVHMDASLTDSSRILHMLGYYPASAVCRAVQKECAQHIIRRDADHRQNIARQLSLTPPGAYEEPTRG